MTGRTLDGMRPAWPFVTIWVVVNAVAVLQAAGFLTRVVTGQRTLNQLLGAVIIGLAVPTAVALGGLLRRRAGVRHLVGPLAFLAFVAVELVVDYVAPVEFRQPPRPEILVPYLTLFFGAIVLMGLPMYRMDRRRWWVTASTATLLLVAMGVAMRAGVA